MSDGVRERAEQPMKGEGRIEVLDKGPILDAIKKAASNYEGVEVIKVVLNPEQKRAIVYVSYPQGLSAREAASNFEAELSQKPPESLEGYSFKVVREFKLENLLPSGLQKPAPDGRVVEEREFMVSSPSSKKKPFSHLRLLPQGFNIYVPEVPVVDEEGVIDAPPPTFSSLAGTQLHGVRYEALEDFFKRRAYQVAYVGALRLLNERGVVPVTGNLEERKNSALQGYLRDLASNIEIAAGDKTQTLSELLSKSELTDAEKKALKKFLFGRSRVDDEDFDKLWGAMKAAYSDPSKVGDLMAQLGSYVGSGFLSDLKGAYASMTAEENVQQLLSRAGMISKVVHFSSEQGIMIAKLVDTPTREVYVAIHINEETGSYEIEPIPLENVKSVIEGGKRMKYVKLSTGAEIRWDESKRTLDSFVYLRADAALKLLEGFSYGEFGAEAGAGAKLKLGPLGIFGAAIASIASEVEPTSSLIILEPDGSIREGTFKRISVSEMTGVLGFDLQLLKDLSLATQVFRSLRYTSAQGGLSLNTARTGGAMELRYTLGENLTLFLGAIYALEQTPLGNISELGVPIGVEIPLGKGRLVVRFTVSERKDPITGEKDYPVGFILTYRF